jgi:two-component system, OmpR family, alkaline phosphatase synthesis response regulator PhoP
MLLNASAPSVGPLSLGARSGLQEIAWPKLLFVDDDPNIVAAMERNLRPYKLRLTRAYHGMQGILSAVTEKPDVIITDMAMPLATGTELIECLARNPATQKTPIIILTGKASTSLTAKLKSLDVVAVLHKPLRFEEVLEELRRVVHISHR